MVSLVSSPELVGREQEIGALRAALARAADGEPGIVVVAGEAGIGKTRLMDEFAGRVRDDGMRVLVGGCLDLADDGLPYAPLTEALRTFLRDLPPERIATVLGPARDEIGRLLPGIGPIAPVAEDARGLASDARSGLAQASLFGLVLGLLGDLGAEAPTVLVFEDLHWVDRGTRDLVTFLARNLERDRLLLVLTVRTDGLAHGDPVSTWLAALERDPRTSRLDLDRLDRAEVGRQVATDPRVRRGRGTGRADPRPLRREPVVRRGAGRGGTAGRHGTAPADALGDAGRPDRITPRGEPAPPGRRGRGGATRRRATGGGGVRTRRGDGPRADPCGGDGRHPRPRPRDGIASPAAFAPGRGARARPAAGRATRDPRTLRARALRAVRAGRSESCRGRDRAGPPLAGRRSADGGVPCLHRRGRGRRGGLCVRRRVPAVRPGDRPRVATGR